MSKPRRQEDSDLCFIKIEHPEEFPLNVDRKQVIRFFHETMKPYEDSLKDIEHIFDYLFLKEVGKGGFLMLVVNKDRLAGALLMLNTGMKGCVPENILLFVSVLPSLRGNGIGRRLVECSIAECKGDVKLHVEYDNPAKRLYERIGFINKYAEMRFIK